MVTVQKIVRHLYRDSLTLMQLSVKLTQLPGVTDPPNIGRALAGETGILITPD